MHYLDSSDSDGTAHLFEWIGPMSPEGHPAFLDKSNWNDASKNFRYVKHFSKDVLLLFVNVVRATTFTKRSKKSLDKCFTYLKFLLASFQLDVSRNAGCPSGDMGPIHSNK